MADPNNDILLEVDSLETVFDVEGGRVLAVDGASFQVRRGRILAIVGESGCGKSVTAYSILRLIQPPGRIIRGRIVLHPEGAAPIEITALSEKDETLYELRGGLVSMIFQEPMTALSPVHTIGNQLREAILLHQEMTPNQADIVAAKMLARVGIPAAKAKLQQYPHELSGGMRQRVVIAMALVANPQLLIADEPTTALDVTIQAQILRLIKQLQSEMQTAVLLITHDLGVVAQTADDVAVMYLGRIVESASVRDVLKRPAHPYTRGLLASLPSLAGRAQRLASIEGSVPSLHDVPRGCPFHPRCRYAQAGRCDVAGPPPLEQIAPGHRVACLRAEEIDE